MVSDILEFNFEKVAVIWLFLVGKCYLCSSND